MEDGGDGKAPRDQVQVPRVQDRGSVDPDGPLRRVPGGARVPLLMFGIVVCPRCKRAEGGGLEKKTTTCDCGFEIRIPTSRPAFETSDARELAAAVQRMKAELRGGTKAVGGGTRPRSGRRGAV